MDEISDRVGGGDAASEERSEALMERKEARTILLIEDDDNLRAGLVDRLELHGYQVLAGEDGLAGIALAKEHHPDLILCDIMMPGISGYGVMEAVQEDPATADIPFIFMSAKAERSDIRAGMKLGADDYLCKPVAKEELLGAIESRLERSAQMRRHAMHEMGELKTDLANSLSHEFLTPISGILGPARLLETVGDDPDANEVRTMGCYIRVSAERLHGLIRRFMMYSDLLMNSTPFGVVQSHEPGIAPVKATVLNAAEKVAKDWKRAADLRLTVVSGAVLVPCTLLGAVAEALVDNAFKFSKAGTSVEVSTRFHEGVFQLQVSDQGRGMSPSQIEGVSAFRQFDRRRYEQQGIGLGLAIVSLICRRHGGDLKVESQIGHGCRVTVGFPEALVD